MNAEANFEKELDSIIDTYSSRQAALAKSKSDEKTADSAFYQSWNQHRDEVVAPVLRRIAETLQRKQILAETREIPAHKVMLTGATEVVGTTHGISLCVYTSEASKRSAGYGVRDSPCLQFIVQGREVVVEAGLQRTEFKVTDLTEERIKAICLEFLKGVLGNRGSP